MKCSSDGGIFLDIPDDIGNQIVQSYFRNVVTLQVVFWSSDLFVSDVSVSNVPLVIPQVGSILVDMQNIGANLPKGCTAERDPGQCFFAQYLLADIHSPTFILQSAYDRYQIRNFLVPPKVPTGEWTRCKNNPRLCSPVEVNILQEFRKEMVLSLMPIQRFSTWGLYLISCFYHTLSQADSLWNGPSRVANTSAASAVGEWVYRGVGTKYVDCPYPCNPTCIE